MEIRFRGPPRGPRRTSDCCCDGLPRDDGNVCLPLWATTAFTCCSMLRCLGAASPDQDRHYSVFQHGTPEHPANSSECQRHTACPQAESDALSAGTLTRSQAQAAAGAPRRTNASFDRLSARCIRIGRRMGWIRSINADRDDCKHHIKPLMRKMLV